MESLTILSMTEQFESGQRAVRPGLCDIIDPSDVNVQFTDRNREIYRRRWSSVAGRDGGKEACLTLKI